MAETKDKDQPFRVVTVKEQGLHSGYVSMESAEAAAERLNGIAETAGYKTRYEAIPKP